MSKLSQGSYSVNFADYVRDLEQKGKNIIKLQTGDPFFSTHSSIITTAISAMNSGKTKYCDSQGLLEFRKAICKKLLSANSIDASVSNILVTHGAVQGLSIILNYLIDDGDECLILEPYWRAYEANTKINNGNPIILEPDSNNKFDLDVSKLKSKITKRTKAIIINTPNNPSGAIYKESELKELYELADKEDFFIISDEVYESITYDDNKHFSIGSLEKKPNRVISLFSFSKTYSMTGWRIGYIHASSKLIGEFLKFNQFNITSVPEFSQLACLEALQGTESATYIKEMNSYYNENRLLIIKMLKGTWLENATIIPSGSFYCLIKFEDTQDDPLFLAKKIVDEVGVSLTPGIAFGDNMKNYLRLCFACQRDMLKDAIRRLVNYNTT